MLPKHGACWPVTVAVVFGNICKTRPLRAPHDRQSMVAFFGTVRRICILWGCSWPLLSKWKSDVVHSGIVINSREQYE